MSSSRLVALRRWRLWPEAPRAAELTGDAAIALVVAVAQVLGSFAAGRGQPERDAVDGLAVVLLLAGPAALVARRSRPGLVVGVVLAATLVYMVLGYPYGPVMLSAVVAIYSAVARGQRLVAWVGALALYGAHMAYRALFGDEPSMAELLGVAAWILLVVLGAEVVRAYQERAAERERVAQEATRRRAGDERLRIARELHDVLAHHISLIGVQAAAGLHLMDRRPEQARTSLAAIEEASREAMLELRSVLDILQNPADVAPRSPAASLERLDSLRAQAAAAGLAVEIEVEGEVVDLPSAVESAAFRVVQEAVTNVIRHAGATAARVRLSYGERELAISVEDDGAGQGPVAPGTGQGPVAPGTGQGPVAPGTGQGPVAPGTGLTGMRERVEALSGRFESGPLPGGGFRVRAWLPTGGAR